MSFSPQEESLFSLEFTLDLSPAFGGLSQTLKKQQLHPSLISGRLIVVDRHLRSPTGRYFGVLNFDAFRARSTPPHQHPAATRPSSSITGDPATRRPALRFFPMATRRRVDNTLLRVNLTRWRVGPKRLADHHRRPPPPVQPLFFEFMLLCYVTFSFPCCLLANLNRMGLIGVVFFSPFFLVSVWKPFFTVTLHLNFHGFLGSLFRCFNGVFELSVVLSITSMRRGKGFLGLHSHLYFSFMISLLFEIYPVWVSSMLLCNLFVVE
jgi:hypothetical protein